MAAVLKTVLARGYKLKGATDSYICDILIDVVKISMMEVVNHFKEFGLRAKPSESLVGGAALGL